MRKTSLVIALVTIPTMAGATNYYVGPNGNNANPGTNPNSPLATIQRGVDLAQPGDTVFVLEGNYAGFTPHNGQTIKGAVGLASKISGAPANANDMIGTAGSVNVRLEQLDIGPPTLGTPSRGVHLGGTDGLQIVRCRIQANMGAQGGPAQNLFVLETKFVDCGTAPDGHALYLGSGGRGPRAGNKVIRSEFTGQSNGNAVIHVNSKVDSGEVYVEPLFDGCYIHDNPGCEALNLYSARGAIIQNTLVVERDRVGRLFDFADSSPDNICTDAVMVNCTIIAPNGTGINQRMSATGTIVFNSIFWCQTPFSNGNGNPYWYDANSNLHITSEAAADAVFENWRAGDYRIKEGGPAHGAGRQDYRGIMAPGHDITGAERTGYDIGAYGVINGTDAPPAPPQNVVASETSPGCVTVTWRSNSESDVTGYTVYWGPQSVAGGAASAYANSRDVGKVTSTQICALGAGVHYVAVRAYDATGNFSGYSVERSVTVQGADVAAPTVVSLNPADGATGAATDALVKFALVDNGTGVDTNTVSVAINGVAPAWVRYTGTPARFDATCRSTSALPPHATVSVVVGVSDRASPPNTGGRTWSFTTAGVQPAMPSGVTALQTGAGCVTVSWQSNVEPDLAGYVVYYGAQSVAQGGATQYGDSVDVGTATAREVCNLPEGLHYFALRAYNATGDYSRYSTEHAVNVVAPDTQAPRVLVVNPGRGEQGVAPGTRVQFALLDSGSGVDTNSVSVQINGTAPASIAYSGDPASFAVTCVPAGVLPTSSVIAVSVSVSDRASPSNAASDTWSFTTRGIPPAAPTGVTAQGSNTGDATVSWSANPETDLAAYVLYFGTESVVSGPATAYADSVVVGPQETSYPVGGLAEGRYYFALKARNDDGLSSAYSAEAHADVTNGNTQGPLPPQALLVAETSPGCMTVSWRASSEPDVVGYMIHYGTQSVAQGESAIYSVSRDVRNATADEICRLGSGTYFVAVRAYNALGAFSGFSTEKSLYVAGADVVGPALALAYPQQGATDVPQNTEVFLVLSDNLTGVDTATVDILVGGQQPAVVVYSGDASSQAAVCQMSTPLPPNSIIAVEVTASDRASPANVTSRAWTFTTGDSPDTTPPVVEEHLPPHMAENVDPRAQVVVVVRDDIGLDPSRAGIYVNDELTPATISVDETGRMTLQRQTHGGLPLGLVVVRAVVYDLAGNQREVVYEFTVGTAVTTAAAPAQIVPDGYWVDDTSRPLEVRNLPLGWSVRIFDAAGHEVRSFENREQDALTWTWDFTNAHGRPVAKALYLVRVIDEGGAVKQSGRFLVRSGQ